MNARWFFLVSAAIILLSSSESVYAAKPRVVKKSSAPVTRSATGFSTARLSRATNSVVVTFINMNKAKKIAYELSYSARGIPQGAMGAISPSGQASDSRDLYFGTCSKGVCTPHTSITGATLTVTATLSSGGTNTKRYRIKI